MEVWKTNYSFSGYIRNSMLKWLEGLDVKSASFVQMLTMAQSVYLINIIYSYD